MTACQDDNVEQEVGVPDNGSFDELLTMRAGLDTFAASVSVREQVAEVVDSALSLPGRRIPVRTYRPAGADDAVLVWFHGGGFVAGSLEAVDPLCRTLARRLGSTVLSVGYRLAPENRSGFHCRIGAGSSSTAICLKRIPF